MNKRWIMVLCPIYGLIFAALACGMVVMDTAYYACPTQIPIPTVTILPGTPLPPILIPPTPYVITPPQDFYVDDAVFVGQQNAPLRLRFRLQNIMVQPTASGNLVTWEMEISNIGSLAYETVPPALMLITRITTVNGVQVGTWRTSETAMNMAGFINENYDPILPATTRLYRLAAYIPSGTVSQFTYLLDGEGNNRITWTNQRNPYC